MRLQSRRFGEYGVQIYGFYTPVHSDADGSTWLGPIYGSNRTVWNLNWKQMTHAKLNS